MGVRPSRSVTAATSICAANTTTTAATANTAKQSLIGSKVSWQYQSGADDKNRYIVVDILDAQFP